MPQRVFQYINSKEVVHYRRFDNEVARVKIAGDGVQLEDIPSRLEEAMPELSGRIRRVTELYGMPLPHAIFLDLVDYVHGALRKSADKSTETSATSSLKRLFTFVELCARSTDLRVSRDLLELSFLNEFADGDPSYPEIYALSGLLTKGKLDQLRRELASDS